MKKFYGRLFILTCMALVALRALAAPPVTARLDLDDGICSGTIIAPSVILSAGHCFEDNGEEDLFPVPPPTTMRVDGYQVKILAIVTDDADHALVKVDFVFHAHATLGTAPAVGAKVHYWGNPAGLRNVYREGYVTSYKHSQMLMNVNGFFGDSGAGIFDEAGNIVGVVSYIEAIPHFHLVFEMMGAYPLEFTPLQYDMMGVSHGATAP